ncbi:MAG: 4'-phosphopantetheinyl transferase superfamily protein [Oscillospiraceae bacterium]|nr:4'-phosphopantetheinyl transferase superfamily protein [Oscillospiraceae bacterium]
MELRWYDILQKDGEPDWSVVGEERRRRADAMRHDADRLRTMAGETLARRMLASRLGCTAAEAPLQWDGNGKPVAPGTGLYVSISHSGAYAVCALDERPVGVDIEAIRTFDPRLMRRVCSEEELRYLNTGDSTHRFWELWTAKEALFKLTGHGPLLRLSKLALPQDTAIWYSQCHGCAVSVAQYL